MIKYNTLSYLIFAALVMPTICFGPHAFAEVINCEPGSINCSGTSGDDIIKGTDVGDEISGGDGNDKINGFGEHDQLIGGFGDDVLLGGSDNKHDYLEVVLVTIV